MNTQLAPYLAFDGTAADAMQFYHQILGGELTIQPFTDMPDEMMKEADEATKKRVLHAQLTSADMVIYASDSMPGQQVIAGTNVTLNIMTSERDRFTEVFAKLAEGGTISMPLEEQFWGDTYGMLTDKFGIQWSVNITKAA